MAKNQKNLVGIAHALLTIATCRRAAMEAEKTEAFEFDDDSVASFEKLRDYRHARIEYRAGGAEQWYGKKGSRTVYTRPTFLLRIVSTHRNGDILTVSDKVSDVMAYAERWGIQMVNAEEFNGQWNAEE